MLTSFGNDDDERDPFGRIRSPVYDDRPDTRGLSTISQSVGMEGANNRTDVAVAEKLLHQNGVLDTNQTKGPTGYFGMRADQAIRTFQKDRGLKVDGLMLPNGPTIKALQAGTQKAPTMITPGLAPTAPATPKAPAITSAAAPNPQRKLPRLPDEKLLGPGGLTRPNLILAGLRAAENAKRTDSPAPMGEIQVAANGSLKGLLPASVKAADASTPPSDTDKAFAALDAMTRKPDFAGPSKMPEKPSSDPDRDWEYYTGPHLAQGLRALADLVNTFSPGADIAEAKDEAAKATEAAGKGDVVGTLGHTGMTAAELADTLLPGNASLWAKGVLAAVIRKVGSGPFGDRIKGDTLTEAVDHLEKIKTGVVADAVHFPGAGKYDLPYGHSGDGRNSGLGWAKIKEKHPEITPEVLEGVSSKMKLKGRPKNPDKSERLNLAGGGYKGTVEHLYDGHPYRWLNTFYKPGVDATPGKGRRGRKAR